MYAHTQKQTPTRIYGVAGLRPRFEAETGEFPAETRALRPPLVSRPGLRDAGREETEERERSKRRAGREPTQADRHPLMTKLLWLVPPSAGQRGALSRSSLPGLPSWLMPQGVFPENEHVPGRGFRRGSRGTFETLQQDQETAGAQFGRRKAPGNEGGSGTMPPLARHPGRQCPQQTGPRRPSHTATLCPGQPVFCRPEHPDTQCPGQPVPRRPPRPGPHCPVSQAVPTAEQLLLACTPRSLSKRRDSPGERGL